MTIGPKRTLARATGIDIPPRSLVIADAQLIEEFLRLDKMDVLGSYQLTIMVSNHLGAGIRDREHQVRYRQAIADCHIHEAEIREMTELETFLRLDASSRLSACERAGLALALHRRCKLVIDHNRALAKAINEAGIDTRALVICHPREIVLDLIRAQSLSADAAVRMKASWSFLGGDQDVIGSLPPVTS